MTNETKDLVAKMEAVLGYQFADKQLLLQALTHRSFVKDPGHENEMHNERLEFLGDAILSFVAAQVLFSSRSLAQEGTLSQLRSQYVCEVHLAEKARFFELGSHVRVAKAMRLSGPLDLPSILSDTLEALFGAVFLDGGLDCVREVIFRILGPLPLHISDAPKDSKTQLQERLQKGKALTPTYRVIQMQGPSHAPQFVVEVSILDQALAQGGGSSKKEAAQKAAQKALEEMDKMVLEKQGN